MRHTSRNILIAGLAAAAAAVIALLIKRKSQLS
jgi:hypothetical protein